MAVAWLRWPQQVLTATQRAALEGVKADGSPHTKTIPGLGTYRVTAISGKGPNRPRTGKL